ncbi:MAG: addiction module toxin RelE, partial [Candidatus Bipolaricaulis sp.]|nr:addiction module toxin RelE [Candidatus Bipolaricaulis sp.]
RAYRDFVKQGPGASVWQTVRGGSLLGSEEFINSMRPRLMESPQDPNVLRRERDAARPSLQKLFAQTESRSDRDRLIHDAVREHHYKLREVADHLGLHFTTISVIAKRGASRIQK